jgi:hypothetical protein
LRFVTDAEQQVDAVERRLRGIAGHDCGRRQANKMHALQQSHRGDAGKAGEQSERCIRVGERAEHDRHQDDLED